MRKVEIEIRGCRDRGCSAVVVSEFCVSSLQGCWFQGCVCGFVGSHTFLDKASANSSAAVCSHVASWCIVSFTYIYIYIHRSLYIYIYIHTYKYKNLCVINGANAIWWVLVFEQCLENFLCAQTRNTKTLHSVSPEHFFP